MRTAPDGTPGMHAASAIWSRLDVPGHDACWLERHSDGWTVRGIAVFAHPAGPAAVQYRVDCAADWVTRRGEVRGSVGTEQIELSIERDDHGRWKLNGIEAHAVAGLIDLDFGFTPATNLTQLRRIALGVGQTADITVAWLDVDSPELTVLPQRYARRDQLAYWYESPTVGYEALLELREDGFIAEYPGLWRAVGRR